MNNARIRISIYVKSVTLNEVIVAMENTGETFWNTATDYVNFL